MYFYPPQKREKIIIVILGIVGFITHFWGTNILSVEAGKVVSNYKGYTNLPCVLYSFAVFVGLRNIGEKLMKNKTVYRVVSFVASYALPIYLLHYFFLDTARRLFKFDETTIIYRIGAPFIVIPIVIGVTWLLRKIPLVKKTQP